MPYNTFNGKSLVFHKEVQLSIIGKVQLLASLVYMLKLKQNTTSTQ